MSVLVIAEHGDEGLKTATLNTVTAGTKLGKVDVLVVGNGVKSVADEASKISGVEKVILVDDAIYNGLTAENVSALLADMADGYTHILAPGTTMGKAIIPRVAALKDCQPISEIIEVISEKSFKRPIYAGNAIVTVETTDQIVFATVRTTAFDMAETSGSASTEEKGAGTDTGLTKFISSELVKSDRPELTSAKIVISGGRAMGDSKNFALIDAVADKLGAAVGASRAAVDSGYAPNDYQVGQTGKVVAPDLYIAVGISGAIQHLAGMKDSKVIVCINNDKDAPIFQVADYGLEQDLFEALPALEKAL
ncbi:MAG: electron transfer flavoprotein subunit alpha/FixB family protein [Alphaproteobacteria bacterium]